MSVEITLQLMGSPAAIISGFFLCMSIRVFVLQICFTKIKGQRIFLTADLTVLY